MMFLLAMMVAHAGVVEDVQAAMAADLAAFEQADIQAMKEVYHPDYKGLGSVDRYLEMMDQPEVRKRAVEQKQAVSLVGYQELDSGDVKVLLRAPGTESIVIYRRHQGVLKLFDTGGFSMSTSPSARPVIRVSPLPWVVARDEGDSRILMSASWPKKSFRLSKFKGCSDKKMGGLTRTTSHYRHTIVSEAEQVRMRTSDGQCFRMVFTPTEEVCGACDGVAQAMTKTASKLAPSYPALAGELARAAIKAGGPRVPEASLGLKKVGDEPHLLVNEDGIVVDLLPEGMTSVAPVTKTPGPDLVDGEWDRARFVSAHNVGNGWQELPFPASLVTAKVVDWLTGQKVGPVKVDDGLITYGGRPFGRVLDLGPGSAIYVAVPTATPSWRAPDYPTPSLQGVSWIHEEP